MGVENFRELVMLFYGDRFVGKMKKALIKPIVGPSFTSALAGDVWNDENRIFGQRLA